MYPVGRSSERIAGLSAVGLLRRAVVQMLTPTGFKGIDANPAVRQGIKDFFELADHSEALFQGRIRRRLRHRA